MDELDINRYHTDNPSGQAELPLEHALTSMSMAER